MSHAASIAQPVLRPSREGVHPAGIPIWRLGIWWFLGSEVAVFGGLIATFLLYRLRHPEWVSEMAHTISWVGATNTIILLTSSLTMILAHHYAIATAGHAFDPQKFIRKGATFLGITNLLGLCFLGFKAYEYTHEIGAGLVPARSLFWGFYFLMTGLHGLHVIGGLVANTVVYSNLRRGLHVRRIESAGIYWHFVDVVWIFLFPLLYLSAG